jgi:stage V sporulation protein G
MDRLQPDDAGSSLVRITVLSVTPVHAGKLFALALVEVDIDGVQITIHSIRAVHVADPVGTRIELPQYRNPNGRWQTAITLPEEVRGPIGDAVLDTLIERGIAKRRFATPISAG